MRRIDVFNGDADGICALVQLRLAEATDASEQQLVTGPKRDIALMQGVAAQAGDHITVLDVSLDKNRTGLISALKAGAYVLYVDHHYPGEIPEHPALETNINTSATTCTSLLINARLRGAYPKWAIGGAFGDNLDSSARALADTLSCSQQEIETLKEFGVCLNYNSYGRLEDLRFHPRELYLKLVSHASPQNFMHEDAELWETLRDGYRQDMARARAIPPHHETPGSAAWLLPDEPWARRASGSLANWLANENPARAHAILSKREDDSWLVSVRAPINDRQGADQLCRRFPSGGGRAAAAGINALPPDQFDTFLDALAKHYSA